MLLLCVQAPASRSVKESREELVARLREEQADQAARLVSLKQATSHSSDQHLLIAIIAPFSKDKRISSGQTAAFHIACGKVNCTTTENHKLHSVSRHCF